MGGAKTGGGGACLHAVEVLWVFNHHAIGQDEQTANIPRLTVPVHEFEALGAHGAVRSQDPSGSVGS